MAQKKRWRGYFEDVDKAATESELAKVEKAAGITLHASLRELYTTVGGGLFVSNTFLGDDDDETEYDVAQVVSVRDTDDEDGVAKLYTGLVKKKLLPARFVPFANDSGGNFFVLENENGSIWFADMEAVKGKVPKPVRLAKSLDEFLQALQDDDEEDDDDDDSDE